ncbi:MAG: winged helix-turn-helix transcriptional regulator, partial [Candidatus Thorarchaeota archaeon]
RKLGLTANAIRKRVDKLTEIGVLVKFMVIPAPAMLNADYVIAIINTDGTEDVDEFTNLLGENEVIHHVSVLASTKGGAYHVAGQYAGTDMLSELGAYLRGLDGVKQVEIHPTLEIRGQKIELKKLHVKVLNCLKEDPRMTLSDLSKHAGISARSARRAIKELKDAVAVKFTVRWNLAAGGLVSFFTRVEWDEMKISRDKVVEWIRTEYADNFWGSSISATAPVVLVAFVTEDLKHAGRVSTSIGKAEFIKSATTMISYSTKKFPWWGEMQLEKMLEDKSS